MADNSSPVNFSVQLPFGVGSEFAPGFAEGQSIEIQNALKQATSMTNSIYAGELTIRDKEDPEIPDDHYFVFRVADSGTMDEIRPMA